jgi:hypothetical protein
LLEGGSILNYASTFQETISDLQLAEVKYEEDDLGLLLLYSLHAILCKFPRYHILLSCEELTLAHVYEALHLRENMKNMVHVEEVRPSWKRRCRGRTEQKKEKTMIRARTTKIVQSPEGRGEII